jgi:hypothetical protein
MWGSWMAAYTPFLKKIWIFDHHLFLVQVHHLSFIAGVYFALNKYFMRDLVTFSSKNPEN